MVEPRLGIRPRSHLPQPAAFLRTILRLYQVCEPSSLDHDGPACSCGNAAGSACNSGSIQQPATNFMKGRSLHDGIASWTGRVARDTATTRACNNTIWIIKVPHQHDLIALLAICLITQTDSDRPIGSGRLDKIALATDWITPVVNILLGYSNMGTPSPDRMQVYRVGIRYTAQFHLQPTSLFRNPIRFS
jgi:hypothetical protein